MSLPLISIIIPTYNRAHLISETLNSILLQTYENWECIIIDDGSTDDTDFLLHNYTKKDDRFKYHKRPKERPKGPNSSRNFGFEISKGEYLKWFDSDDLMHINLLENQIKVINDTTECVVCKVVYYDFKNDKFLKENKIYSDNLIEDYLVGKITFYISGPLWKRSIINKQKELFDETIKNLDDWDFNLRMLYQEPSIIYLEEPLIQYRVHEASLSNEIGKLNFEEIQSEFKAIRKHLLLIRENKKANSKKIKLYLKNRHKSILREALVENDMHKFYYLKELLILELQLFQFLEMTKSIFGFIIYSIFKKGYKLL
ncbi:glycosyltransferase [Flavobacterium sp. LS1R49]|uniref:Glycosyltransferase n=1 Tax=Flavobacterium shii TaxID=2987687 RepID=A0A9X2ZAF6_9FLAO|nr:glycosyltransferase [Flavobacterium shii]MCV9927451.1 glycosyltransferase [Flavobacterium shii]